MPLLYYYLASTLVIDTAASYQVVYTLPRRSCHPTLHFRKAGFHESSNAAR